MGRSEITTTLNNESLQEWSRRMFEYVAVWLTEESTRTGRLLGHVQVFDLADLTWWHLMGTDFVERTRAGLDAAANYVEINYKVYAINASGLFSTVWELAEQFLPARTAAKVCVSTGIPDELIEILGSEGHEMLQAVMCAVGEGRPVPV